MSVDEIQTLASYEAIRKRPAMYVGSMDASTPNYLLMECLCAVRAAAQQNTATRVDVNIFNGGTAVIVDDGPGWDVTMVHGRRIAEALLTELFACRAAKTPEEQQKLCHYGITTLVALSATFDFWTWRDGRRWWMGFLNGRSHAPLSDVQKGAERGTTIMFKLDSTILPIIEFDVGGLRACTAALAQDGLYVELRDQRKAG